MKITNRQKELLFIIVNEYVSHATPIGSKKIIKNYMKDLSAATIRNDMAKLEKEGLIEKVYNSSGRIPTIAGYKFFEKNNEYAIDKYIEKKLKEIFINRNLSINEVIETSVSLINETLNLPLVITQVGNDELLKRIDLISLSKETAIVVLITSTGNIFKNVVHFEKEKEIKNLEVCIRIFNDRLTDTKLSEILSKIELLKKIIEEKVIDYENNLRKIIEKIFTFNTKIKTDVKGQYSLLSQPEFNDREKLLKVMLMLEKSSIWEQIAFNQHQSGGATAITFGDSFGVDELCIASTEIILPNNNTQISVIGPTRMDFSNVKGVLNFVKNEVEKYWKDKK
ncbi:MAG: heat-inducible transcriptional repressor HrcA [Mycoplasmoidaceae bacterium]